MKQVSDKIKLISEKIKAFAGNRQAAMSGDSKTAIDQLKIIAIPFVLAAGAIALVVTMVAMLIIGLVRSVLPLTILVVAVGILLYFFPEGTFGGTVVELVFGLVGIMIVYGNIMNAGNEPDAEKE